MSRPRTDAFWVDQIYQLSAQRLKPRQVCRELEKIGKDKGRNDWPLESTVRRKMKEFNQKSEPERREYALFRWPEPMTRGELPWEASQATLTLMRYLDEKGLERPNMRLVTWFWRVCLATGDAGGNETGIDDNSLEMLIFTAAMLGSFDVLQTLSSTPVDFAIAERLLAYLPWRSPQAHKAYLEAMERAGVTPDSQWESLTSAVGDVPPRMMSEMMGEFAKLFTWQEDGGAQYRSMAEQAATWVDREPTSGEGDAGDTPAC